VSTNTGSRRRNDLRKATGTGVLRLELKDRAGHSRWLTADVLDLSEEGAGVALATPIAPGTKLTVRTSPGGAGGHSESRAQVRYCCERPNGAFRAGLEFIHEEQQGSSQQDETAAPCEALDYYELLELSPNASFETVGRVYRILAQRLHPDNAATGNAEAFVRLSNAYRVLSDPEQRAGYDATCAQNRKLRWKIFDQSWTSSGPESEKRKRQGILGLLYAKVLHNPDQAGMTVLEFEDLLGCPREHLQAALWYLRGKGFIVGGDGGRYSLTVAGFEDYESHAAQHPVNETRLIAAEAGSPPARAGQHPN